MRTNPTVSALEYLAERDPANFRFPGRVIGVTMLDGGPATEKRATTVAGPDEYRRAVVEAFERGADYVGYRAVVSH